MDPGLKKTLFPKQYFFVKRFSDDSGALCSSSHSSRWWFSEKELRFIASRLDILAANKHCFVRGYKTAKKISDPRQVVSQSSATIASSLWNSMMSDVSTTQVVSVQTGERSTLSDGRIAVSERLDANTSVIGAGGNEILLLCNVSLTKRVTHRMVQDE